MNGPRPPASMPMHSLNQLAAIFLVCGAPLGLYVRPTLAQSQANALVPEPAATASDEAALDQPAVSNDGSRASRALFEKGLSLVREGNYLEAEIAFQESLKGDPPLEAHFASGQVALALGKPCQALSAYDAYLKAGEQQMSPSKRQRVERHIRQLRQGGASEAACHPTQQPGELTAVCDLEDIRARVDNKNVLLGSVQSLPAGTHKVEFFGNGGIWQPTFVLVAPGGSATVKCAPPPPPPPPTVVRMPAESSMGSSEFSGGQKLSLAITGTGLGLAVATLSHYFWNRGRYDAWKRTDEELRDDPETIDDEGQGTSSQLAEQNDLASSIQNARRVTVGLGIASGVVTAAGLTLFYFETRKQRDTNAQSTQSLSARASTESMTLTWSGTW